jgi:hypothetical protein
MQRAAFAIASWRLGRDPGRPGYEAVAPPGHGFDESRVAGIVAERRPELADYCLQDRFAHELVTPDFVEQRILGEQRARLPDERAEHGERRGRERDRCVVAHQGCIRLVQPEPVEAHAHRVGGTRGLRMAGTRQHFGLASPQAVRASTEPGASEEPPG